MAFNYKTLTFNQLINKIEISNFFNLPRMVAEALRKLQSLISANEPSYKVYTALLTQSGTDAPVATVLENTLGGIPVWSYVDVGTYEVTLTGVDLTQSYVVFGSENNNNQYDSVYVTVVDKAFEYIRIITRVSTISSTEVDDALLNTSIEIRVYN
jgi:hypothetical protein